MKKAILTIAIAGFFAACNQKPVELTNSTTTEKTTSDTAGLAQFKDWKEQQQIINNESVNEVKDDFNTNPVDGTKEALETIVHEPVRKEPVAEVSEPTRRSTPRSVVRVPRTAKRTETSNSGSGAQEQKSTSGNGSEDKQSTAGTSTTVGSGSSTSDGDVVTSQPDTTSKKKEGWSKAAKGTAIGAGSGAVIGAVISKNKGKGAVIGGIIGAAGGYALGRSKDKNDGRY